jgi:hypothetical protein
MIKRIRNDISGEYINTEFKDFFLMCRVIHYLKRPYSPELIGIAERFNQIINMIARSMTIATPDFSSLWTKALNIGAFLKNRLQHKYLTSSTIPFERVHPNRPTISYLKLFASKCYGHIREEVCSSGFKYHSCTHKALLVRYTSVNNV